MTKTVAPPPALEYSYAAAAAYYLQSLSLENVMESRSQATQRKITVASLDLLMTRRSDIHIFNELLVQYPLPRDEEPGQVVPDNMVVIHERPIEVEGSYDVPWQPVRPFWVLEYVSKRSRRKDYKDNMRKYERELMVPYYLLFQPDKQKLTLYHHNGKRYDAIRPNAAGRLALPELDLEMALLDGWTRFWHKGELLLLPVELQHVLDETTHKLDETTRERDEFAHRAQAAEREVAELREQMKKLRSKPNGTH